MRLVTRLLPLGLLFLIGCASAYDVYHVEDKDQHGSTAYGDQVLFYALPATVVTVDAVVTKKSVTEPICVSTEDKKFLEELGLKVAEASIKVDTATIGSRAEADPTNIYAIKLSRKWYQKLTSSFSLSEGGVLTAAEFSAENQAVDFAVTTLKTIATLAVKTGVAGGKPKQISDVAGCKNERDEIKEIRAVRERLIQGKQTDVNPPDGAALALMLEKLGTNESTLLANFRGEVTTTTGTVHCEVTPPMASPTKLFTLDKAGVKSVRTGVCRIPNDLQTTTEGKETVSVTLTPDTRQLSMTAERVQKARTDPSGLTYRIPAMAMIEVMDYNDSGGKSLAIDRKPIAQLGFVTTLPRSADVSTFQSSVKAALYPSTGAMQKLDLSGTPQGTGFVTGIGDAAGTILDARAAAKKAKEAEEDELAQLERKKKILELRKAIAELESGQ